MATLLDALDQENLDNQREVVKNEKRQSYDNRPYGSFYEKLMADRVSAGAPVPPRADRLDGGPQRGQRSTTWSPSSGPGTRRTTRCSRSSATWTRKRRTRPRRATSGRSRPTRDRASRRCRRSRRTSAHEVREVVPDDVPLTRVHFGFRCPPYGTPEFDALEVAQPDPRRRPWQPAVSKPRARAEDRPGRDRVRAAARGRRLFWGGWVTVRPDSDADTCRAGVTSRAAAAGRRSCVTDDELARARRPDRGSELGALGRVEEVADRLSMFAALFDRPEMINEQLPRYLAVTAEDIADVARDVFRDDNRVVLTYVPKVRGSRPRDHRGSGREGLRRPTADELDGCRRGSRAEHDARRLADGAGVGGRHRATDGRRGAPAICRSSTRDPAARTAARLPLPASSSASACPTA